MPSRRWWARSIRLTPTHSSTWGWCCGSSAATRRRKPPTKRPWRSTKSCFRVEAEEGAVAHMNADHAEATRLYATKLLGADDGAWRITGIDPDGADLALGDRTLRLGFHERVTTAEQMRKALVALAGEARGKG